MNGLFRLEQVPNPTSELLGFKWLEVLAIEPRASTRASKEEKWADRVFTNWYICRTESGMVRLGTCQHE